MPSSRHALAGSVLIAAVLAVGVVAAAADPARPGKRVATTPEVSRRVSGRLPGGGGGAPAVAFVEGHRGPAAAHDLKQERMAFQPGFLVVGVGDTVNFPNLDHLTHNVFALSQARSFDLGLYNRGQTRSVVFDRPGVVDVFCNIHENMHATIVVVPSDRATRVGPDGRFTIGGLPAGDHVVVVWRGGREIARGRATVTATATADGEVSFGRRGGRSR